MNFNMEFVKYSDEYEEIVDLINKEISSETKITNISRFSKDDGYLVVINKQVVGFASISYKRSVPNIQYGILKEYRRLGYGTLILDKLTDYLFDKGYSRVELLISPKNVASYELAKKLGYRLDDYGYGEVEFNPDNEEKMYLTYYKNSYRKIR